MEQDFETKSLQLNLLEWADLAISLNKKQKVSHACALNVLFKSIIILWNVTKLLTVCRDCEIAWGNWSECEDFEQYREPYVVVERVGAGKSCPHMHRESQGSL